MQLTITDLISHSVVCLALVPVMNGTYDREVSAKLSSYASSPALSVGNRLDDPLQKVCSSSPVVACKNTAAPLSSFVSFTDRCLIDFSEILIKTSKQ